MYIGLKKLPVVPVTYREKIRVGIGQKKFFLKQFLMLLADLRVHGLTILVTKNKVSVRSHRENVPLRH